MADFQLVWRYIVLSTLCFCSIYSKIFRPRGVSILKASFYVENQPFTCFDGSRTIPFVQINDDYCDCSDGSDEPGTSACTNGWFHCTNIGHVQLDVPSSRVNDGICDCCDGADEYIDGAQCDNTCKEMGAAALVEYQLKVKAMQEGHKIYKQYVEEGSKARTDLAEQKETLTAQFAQLEERKKEMEALKEEAEAPEKEAKSVHEAWWEEEKQKREKEKEAVAGEEAFQELDQDGDGSISIAEMQQHQEFDIDADQTVSDEEAKEYLEDNEQVDKEFFQATVWPNIKALYSKTKEAQVAEAAPPQEEEPAEEGEEGEDDYHDEEGFEDEEGDDLDDDDDDEVAEPVDLGEMPDYDEATKAWIQMADAARENFKSAEEQFKEVERKLQEVSSDLELDLGAHFEFYAIKGQCFEFTDREYVYKLCPYDRASQKAKSGGAETSLGKWGHWAGPNEDKYSIMMYDNGQNCWNGPNRSVKVHLECGVPNELLSAEEPNRCTYSFRFKTPAVCSSTPPPHPSEHTDSPHTEL